MESWRFIWTALLKMLAVLGILLWTSIIIPQLTIEGLI
jgi:hypothetical protein